MKKRDDDRSNCRMNEREQRGDDEDIKEIGNKDVFHYCIRYYNNERITRSCVYYIRQVKEDTRKRLIIVLR